MPKIMIGGVVREMTPEEEAQWGQEMANLPKPETTPEERIKELAEKLKAAEILLGLEA